MAPILKRLDTLALAQDTTSDTHTDWIEGMADITPLDKIRLPFGGQEIEFQNFTHDSGGVPFLRIRIRENKRFTIFEVDPTSAQKWADIMGAWAKEHAGDVS